MWIHWGSAMTIRVSLKFNNIFMTACENLTADQAVDEFLKRFKAVKDDSELIEHGNGVKFVSQGGFHLRYMSHRYISSPYHYHILRNFFQSEEEAEGYKLKVLQDMVSHLNAREEADSSTDRECFLDDEIFNRRFRTRDEKCKR